jgi:hypothetical protein
VETRQFIAVKFLSAEASEPDINDQLALALALALATINFGYAGV